jgi:predicted nucleic acid-binding protein
LPLPDDPLPFEDLLLRVAAARMAGCQIYDALVGAAAVEVGARLLTADRRALPVYGLLGVDFDLIE